MKKQKGITLIALIITIIVMIILVGVSISVVLDGGLIKKTNDAKISSDTEQAREEVQIAVAAVASDFPGEELSDNMATGLQEELKKVDQNTTTQFVDNQTPEQKEIKVKLYKGINFIVNYEKQVRVDVGGGDQPEPVDPSLWQLDNTKTIITGYLGDEKGNVTVPSELIIDGTTYQISQFGDGSSPIMGKEGPVQFTGTLTIPDDITIASIALMAGQQSGLTKIVIGNNCEINNSFAGCTELEELTIGANAVIYDGAFQPCSTLTEISFTDSAISIGANAFNGLTAKINLGNTSKLTNIGEYAFYNCTGLTTNIELGSNVVIGTYAFNGCTSLTSVTIESGKSESNIEIASYAFSNCTNLDSIEIGSYVTIGDCAFYGCGTNSTSVTVTIGDNVILGSQVMLDSDKLVSLQIGNNATIGSEAFKNSFTNGNVNIGTGANIKNQAFYNCDLQSVTLGAGYSLENDIVFPAGTQINYQS